MEKPTIGRILHVYYDLHGTVRGPFAGIVINTTTDGALITIRVFGPGEDDIEMKFSAEAPYGNCGSTFMPTARAYKWCWPPKESE